MKGQFIGRLRHIHMLSIKSSYLNTEDVFGKLFLEAIRKSPNCIVKSYYKTHLLSLIPFHNTNNTFRQISISYTNQNKKIKYHSP